MNEVEQNQLFDWKNAKKSAKLIEKYLLKVAPVINVSVSTLGGKDRVSLVGKLTLDPKRDWPNGILENSRWFTFHLDRFGTLEVHKGWFKIKDKLRKSRNKDLKTAIARMLKYFSKVKKKYPLGEGENKMIKLKDVLNEGLKDDITFEKFDLKTELFEFKSKGSLKGDMSNEFDMNIDLVDIIINDKKLLENTDFKGELNIPILDGNIYIDNESIKYSFSQQNNYNSKIF